VRRLISETLSGRGRHTQALGILLTLELFQRQFVEGEAPDSSHLPQSRDLAYPTRSA
jgi:hypothetical protein